MELSDSRGEMLGRFLVWFLPGNGLCIFVVLVFLCPVIAGKPSHRNAHQPGGDQAKRPIQKPCPSSDGSASQNKHGIFNEFAMHDDFSVDKK